MARILIAEPYAEVQQLFVHFVAALGHEPIVHDPAVAAVGIDALIIEPAMNGAAELVESLRALNSDLPVVAVSVYPPAALSARIDWTSFHLKPFGLAVLREALDAHLPAVAAAKRSCVACSGEQPDDEGEPRRAEHVGLHG